MSRTKPRILFAALCAGLLALAAALPVAGAAAPGGKRTQAHTLVKKLPKRWLRAHELTGASGAPLADPDHDGACNWVEFKQGTNPLQPNAVATAPAATTAVPASRVIRLQGTVAQVSATGFTLTLDRGLTLAVALPTGAPVVDGHGTPATLSPGASVQAFVSQAADLSLSAVIVFTEPNSGGGDDGDDDDPGAGPPSPTHPTRSPGGGHEGHGPGGGGDD